VENVVIERNLIVWGAGQDLVIVDGGDNGPVFTSLNVDIEYEGLTIQSGTYGIEAIWNFAVGVSDGNLTIRDSALTNNSGPAVRADARRSRTSPSRSRTQSSPTTRRAPGLRCPSPR
jgi:hypothetical protein